MSRIAIVTDSTANLPQDCLQKYDITVTPQVLSSGEQTYHDGVPITPDEFYARLKTARVMPTTSQVSPLAMQQTFQVLVDKGFDVLGIFVSSKLSGTIQSAHQGKDAMGSAGEKVTIADSLSVAMALGFQVLEAARAFEKGAG